jgi:hypothetical protein
MRTRAGVLILAVATVLGLAGCGGEDADNGVATAGRATAAKASTSSSASLSPEDARLKFTQCMRRNGIDLPDPQAEENFRMEVRQKGDREKVQAAMKKCRHFLEAAGMNLDPSDPAVQDALVKFAQCARKNGIDIPDPQPGQGLGGYKDVGREGLKKARELCGEHLRGIRERAGR